MWPNKGSLPIYMDISQQVLGHNPPRHLGELNYSQCTIAAEVARFFQHRFGNAFNDARESRYFGLL